MHRPLKTLDVCYNQISFCYATKKAILIFFLIYDSLSTLSTKSHKASLEKKNSRIHKGLEKLITEVSNDNYTQE